MSSSPLYLDPIVVPLITGETVLDVGCGLGRWGNLIQANFWEAGLDKPPLVDGIDAFQANVEYCSQQKCYRNVWYQVLPSPLPGKWDTVLACEIIEHIEQEKVEDFLKALENAAHKKVIVSTPNYPCFRDGSDTIVGFNDFDAHLSYVPRSYFQRRGYKVIGAGLRKWTKYPGSLVEKIIAPWKPGFESISRLIPFVADSIVAYKDM
ncbi:methyltransferase domain-containing protein [Chlorogloeopsis sp. ULAP01]|uniref:class I SAM-dependent methyltransferase n=1 Tax=Chlorogloeopsis sp. ULAP01 TaxID=3056483 RepID=UPI0025AA4D48|nr:methyltransferase domain-containing protein [Chlorogloeopsis sp. ULAP01]MDM9381591.1 methyltransferase domain-containing protein [Chlorogloeopsis sp. ULAP01]